MPPEFMTPAVTEDILSPFCIFDTDGYNPGSSPDVNEYRSIVWTTKETNIPSTIIVYAAPTFSETIMQPEGEVVELTVMSAHNRGVGLEIKESATNMTVLAHQKWQAPQELRFRIMSSLKLMYQK
jgi:hypothetical protein